MTLVEQDRAAGPALRLDVEAGHAIAQLGRDGQHAFALRRGRGEVEIHAGHDPALLVGRLDRHLARAVGGGTQCPHLEVAAFGGWVVDTPGVRQLQLWDTRPEEVEGYFPEFKRAALDILVPPLPGAKPGPDPGRALLVAIAPHAASSCRSTASVRSLSSREPSWCPFSSAASASGGLGDAP